MACRLINFLSTLQGLGKRIVREHEYIEGAETNQMGSLQFFSGDFEGRVGERMLLVQDEAQLGIFKGDSDCVPPFQGLPVSALTISLPTVHVSLPWAHYLAALGVLNNEAVAFQCLC